MGGLGGGLGVEFRGGLEEGLGKGGFGRGFHRKVVGIRFF